MLSSVLQFSIRAGITDLKVGRGRTQLLGNLEPGNPTIKNEHGAVLLEFGLVFPILFMFLVASVEFSRGLKIREMMSVVSREAAYQAFRQCAAETAPRSCTGTLSSTDACLTRIRVEMGGLAQAVLGNTPFTLSMSVYSYDAARDSILFLGISHELNGNPDPSDFTEAILRDKQLQLLQAHKVIAISEVRYSYNPFFSVGWLGPSSFYESTIY